MSPLSPTVAAAQLTKAQAADAAILIDAIAAAAVAHMDSGNIEAALHLTRFAAVVLPVPARIARAWNEHEWDAAAAYSASEAIAALRAINP